MFIRTKSTTKNGVTYTKQVLAESRRVDGKPRQFNLMDLGHLEIPQREWKKLAYALECLIGGQENMLDDIDKDIWALARKLYTQKTLLKGVRSKQTTGDSGKKEMLAIDIDSLSVEKSRTIGTETVADWAWNQLDLTRIFKRCDFTDVEIAVAKALIVGRMISPGSEMHTLRWFRNLSALSEFPGADISELGKDKFYEMGDKIYKEKDKIEELLLKAGQKIYPHNTATIYLYDLTNTYMEGACLGNPLAEYGHCKSKRYDQPIITLALVVDQYGMPIKSFIYKGNQSEPETLPDIIKHFEESMLKNQTTFFKPTFAMDRGIATSENIAYLQAHGYPYVVIRREDQSENYKEIFEKERDQFELVGEMHKSAYGDMCGVYVRKPDEADASADDEVATVKVLCISDGKAHKEEAIQENRHDKFTASLASLTQSIEKGNIKKPDKIDAKLSGIIDKNKKLASQYDIKIDMDAGKPKGISFERKPVNEDPLFGCYVIETTHTELDASEIWHLYMTLTNVENAFRTMKSDLGFRPVHHQTGKRCGAHLFISVIAYHMIALIRRKLGENQDMRLWSSLRDALSSHTRCTVTANDGSGSRYHIRLNSTPEIYHSEIYDSLGIHSFLSKTVSKLSL